MMKYLGFIVCLLSVLFLFRFAAENYTGRGFIYDTPSGGWTIQVGNVEFKDAKLPAALDRLTNRQTGATAVLSRNIIIPKQCGSTPCYLFLGEIGDLAKVFINDRLIKSQGYSQGLKSVAKHFPMWVDLVGKAGDTLRVRVEAESLYGSGFGLTKGPVFIGDYAAMRSHERILSMESVTFPLMQALVLAILGLLAFVCWRLANMDRSVFSFVVFCMAEAAFMVSFSFVPREYLPVTNASAIHFILRVLGDWGLFETICSLLFFPRAVRYPFRIAFVACIAWFAALYFKGASYPEFVRACQLSFPVIVGTPIAGLVYAIYSWSFSKRLPVKPPKDLVILIPTFAVLTLLQMWDTAVFWGFVGGSYLVKFYLAPLAFVFAVVYVLRYFRNFEILSRANADAQKRALLGSIAMEFSHDLKSPLSALRDCAVLALEKNNPDYSKRVLSDISRRTEEVTGRIQEFLNYSRDEIQEKKTVMLTELANQLSQDLSPRIRSKNLKLDFRFPSESVFVDPISLRRAITNLVENAIDASPQNGMILVEAKLLKKRLLVFVKDFGSGIHESELPKIFEPYYTTKPKSEGIGLGLAIVDRISRQHGGHVQVMSKPNMGSTFVMEVPQ